MPMPLLPTRLIIPPARAVRVARPRLLRLLQAGLSGQVTLICAPAGSGKTTLAAEWLSQVGRPASWYAMEENDNDPESFMSYLAAALKKLSPAVGQGLTLEATPSFLAAQLAAFDPQLAPGILVLDDVHAISNPVVLDLLAFLVEHLPANLQLVMIARQAPPIPLARLRSRGLLNELHLDALRFDLTEAEALFNSVMGLDLPAETIYKLAERAEGWPTALTLYALAFSRSDWNDSGKQEVPPEGERYVMDFLAEEVLHRQPEEVQNFLLQTSVLERMNAELCYCVSTGQTAPPGSHLPAMDKFQELLENLERANLFLVPLDSEHTWFRYHTLFADFLRRNLDRRAPGMARLLHRRAAAWFAARGEQEEAIEHALIGGDYERAAGWLEQVGANVFIDGSSWALRGWLDRLPETVIRARLRLQILRIWLWVERSEAAPARESLAVIEQELARQSSPQDEDIQRDLEITRILLAGALGELEQVKERASRALQRLTFENDRSMRALVLMEFGAVQGFLGSIEEGVDTLESAARAALDAGAPYLAFFAMCNQADLLINQGHLFAAEELYQRALALAGRQSRTWPAVAWPNIALGSICYHRNHLDEAEMFFNRGLELASLWENHHLMANAQVSFAWLSYARGDCSRTMEHLELAKQLVPDPLTREWLHSQGLRLHGLCGDLDPMREWAESGIASGTGDFPFCESSDLLNLALYQVWSGRPIDALALVEQIRAEPSSSLWDTLTLQLIEALALNQSGQPVHAEQALRAGVACARTQGIIRSFLDMGPDLQALIVHVFQTGERMDSFLEQLLSAFEEWVDREKAEHILTIREREVMALVGEGLTNAQIAARLVVAPGTVKKHLDNIYLKLGASSRVQALTLARQRGLLA